MAMKNKTYAHAPNLFALTTACLALTGFACTKSDSLGQAGNKDGGTDTIGKDDTVDTVFCQLNDGRRVPAGAAFAAEDGCNCCVCTSSGQGVCQGAACSFGDAAVASASPGNCQSDQDCLDQGSRLCVFDQGCDSPRGTCMSAGNGVCPGFAVSDLAPFQYCGCDGVTYAIADDVTNPQHYEYPYKPYRHFGACGPNDRADGGPSSPDVPSEARNDGGVDRHDSAPDAAGEDGYEAGTYLCESNADGTCSAVTPNTSCLPLRGVVYDQAANCLSATAITLYCSAWQTNTMGGFATAEGCLQIPKDGGTFIYRTFESDVGNPQWSSWTCDSSLNKYVSEAAECGTSPTDGSSPFGDTSPDGSGVDTLSPGSDGGATEARAATDLASDNAADPCAACTASQVCVQAFDGTCGTNGTTCKTVSDACRLKLSASGAKSCASLSECQSEFCTSPYQCLNSPPCGTEAPQAAIYCYGP